jgi:hypothetical protein
MPRFQTASSELLERTQREEQPLVIIIVPREEDNDRILYGEDFANLSREKATFVKVLDSGDRTRPSWENEATVPTSPLLSANPARDYDVPVGRIAVLVCDWFGNEYARFQGNVRAPALERSIDGIERQVQAEINRLERTLSRVKRDVENENVSGAMRSLLRIFGEGKAGLEPIEEAARLYHKLCDDARQSLEKLEAEGDEAGIRDLERIFRGTDMENEISEARNRVRRG